METKQLNIIAKATGKELARLVDIFDPHTIVIGGDICGAKQYTEKIIQERVSGMGISGCQRNVPV